MLLKFHLISLKIVATTPQKSLSHVLHGLRCCGWCDTVRSMWRFLLAHRLRCDRLKNWHFIKTAGVKTLKVAKPVWMVTIIFEPTPPLPPSPPFFQSVEKSVCVTGFFGVTVFWKLATERTTSCSSNCHFVSYISYLSKPKRSCMPARSANLRFCSSVKDDNPASETWTTCHAALSSVFQGSERFWWSLCGTLSSTEGICFGSWWCQLNLTSHRLIKSIG